MVRTWSPRIRPEKIKCNQTVALHFRANDPLDLSKINGLCHQPPTRNRGKSPGIGMIIRIPEAWRVEFFTGMPPMINSSVTIMKSASLLPICFAAAGHRGLQAAGADLIPEGDPSRDRAGTSRTA
jgi:hypothetical protein